jgi:TonB family protein
MFTLFWFCTRALTAGLVWLIPALAGIGLSKPATPASAGTTAVGMNRRAQHVKSGRLTDIVQVIRVIDGANASLKQGEFEPTVAFEARKRQVLPTRRSFAFVCKGEGNLFRYNPDELIMTVMLQPIERSLSLPDTYSSRHLLSLVLDTRNWMFREYTGVNAFGATVPVSSSSHEEYGIVIAADSVIGRDSTIISLPMDIQRAQAVKPFLRLVVIGEISDSTVFTSYEHSKPTLDDPYESIVQSWFLPFTVTEIQVVDIRSGNILKSITNEKSFTNDTRNVTTDIRSKRPEIPETTVDAQRVESVPQLPALISRVQPIYPPVAKAAHIFGAVEFQVMVSADGKVSDVMFLSGHPLFVKAALDAVKQYRFNPGKRNGIASEMSVRTSVIFPPSQ